MNDTELRKAGVILQPTVESECLACFFTELCAAQRSQLLVGNYHIEFNNGDVCITYTQRSGRWWINGNIAALKGLVGKQGVIKALNILRPKYPKVPAEKLFRYFISILGIARDMTVAHYHSANF